MIEVLDLGTRISSPCLQGQDTTTAIARMGTVVVEVVALVVTEGRSGRMKAEVGMMRVAAEDGTRTADTRRIITTMDIIIR